MTLQEFRDKVIPFAEGFERYFRENYNISGLYPTNSQLCKVLGISRQRLNIRKYDEFSRGVKYPFFTYHKNKYKTNGNKINGLVNEAGSTEAREAILLARKALRRKQAKQRKERRKQVELQNISQGLKRESQDIVFL